MIVRSPGLGILVDAVPQGVDLLVAALHGQRLVGLFFSCLMYQGRLTSDRLTTVTSVRNFSTSCRYQMGKVSLSPLVKMMAFSSRPARMFQAYS